MKPLIMCNTLFSGLALLGMASLATAQTAPRPAAQVTNVENVRALAPMATTITDGHAYAYSDKQINEADLKSKEVSKEIATPKNGEIYIENSYRNVVVKTWDQQKVKVTTTVYYEGESKLTDDEWLEKVNLSLKTLGTAVKIKSGTINAGSFYSYNTPGTYTATGRSLGVGVFNGTGQNIGTKSNIKRILTITVPAGSKIDIESRYADIQLPANIGDVFVDITNGNLETDDLNKLTLRSKYSNANVGDIKTAELEFNNGRFSARNIDDLDIDSKYSTIEMAVAKKLVMRSTNDEYELEEAGEVRGRKNYGNLRITRLNGSLEMDGTNADVKVRNVGPALTLIKLDDKYADVRIPLRSVKNYSIDFTGSYSSVYGNFEKVPVTAKVEDKEKTTEKNVTTTTPHTVTGHSSGGTLAPMARLNDVRISNLRLSDNNSPSRFTASSGDGKGLKVDMKCQNCTVDFK